MWGWLKVVPEFVWWMLFLAVTYPVFSVGGLLDQWSGTLIPWAISIAGIYLVIGAALAAFARMRGFREFLNVVFLWPAVFLLGRQIDEEVARQERQRNR